MGGYGDIQLLRDDGLRLDGRKLDESRPVTIEAGITHGWEKFSGINGLSIGIDHYGASAPGKVLANEYGFTAEKI